LRQGVSIERDRKGEELAICKTFHKLHPSPTRHYINAKFPQPQAIDVAHLFPGPWKRRKASTPHGNQWMLDPSIIHVRHAGRICFPFPTLGRASTSRGLEKTPEHFPPSNYSRSRVQGEALGSWNSTRAAASPALRVGFQLAPLSLQLPGRSYRSRLLVPLQFAIRNSQPQSSR
jgi:hypothetical protein